MQNYLHMAGDSSAAKAAVAAALSGMEKISLHQLSLPPTSASAALPLALPGGGALTDGNAAARYIGGNGLLPSNDAWEVESWIEWEECILRRAVFGSDGSALESALAKISSAIVGRTRLVGDDVTLADVAIFCRLLPLFQQGQIDGELQRYLSGLEQWPSFRAGLDATVAAAPHPAQNTFAMERAQHQASVPKLPVPGQRNILITSALPYVNNVPHLGNIIGCVLSADCYARYCRSRGYNCVYVCGTDEYGTATETKALEESLTCQEICDKYHVIHADIYRWFDIDFDKFGRTPTRQQTEIAQAIYGTLKGADFLQERETEQLYSEALGKFLADRFVCGTCPKCGYEDARGDQCDNCGNLLNPTELINPRCKFSGTTPVLRSTRHMFLDLPKLAPRLQEYITTTSQLGGWSTNCVQVTNGWMKGGLQERAITRDLKWGSPVPEPGYDKKVFYVWFDAPIGYISITANYCVDWKQWWQNPEDVELVQFMGKDNVPFHTIIFPATLLGTGQPWTMMRNISVTEYLNYEGGKFSKSRGIGVFGNDAKETGIPVDVWRYYLLSNRPEAADTDFKWSDLQSRNNGELLANLGNFVNRVLKFTESKNMFSGVVPDATHPAAAEALAALGAKIAAFMASYVAAMEKMKIREGIRIAFDVSRAGNLFITENEIWKMTTATGEIDLETGKPIKKPLPECGAFITGLLGVVALLAAMVEPYIPSASARIAQQLNVAPCALRLSDSFIAKAAQPHTIIPAGHRIGTPEVLFRTINDEEVATLREKFAGSQADRAESAAASVAKKAAAAKKGSAPATPSIHTAGVPGGTKAGSQSKQQPPVQTRQSSPTEAPVSASGVASKAAVEACTDISKLDLRVGRITEDVRKHPDADRHDMKECLYVEMIDVGEGKPRQVVSGLVKFMSEADMRGRLVVVVANMKPANMRGVKSHAMVLCASAADGSKVEFVEPPAGASPGEAVTVLGYEGEPDEVLNPKKKIFEAVQQYLCTDEQLRACYRGTPLSTSAGPCTVQSIIGTIK